MVSFVNKIKIVFIINRTDLYLHFVNREDNSIMEVNNVLSLIDKNIDYLNELYKEFNVLVSEVLIITIITLNYLKGYYLSVY